MYANRRCPIRALVPLLLLSGSVVADEAWRIDQAWDMPGWLSLSGSYRLRYEWLDNPFRADRTRTDDLLVSRWMLSAEARATERLRFGIELQDSRAWGGSAETPLFTDDVNALEALQVYAGYRFDDVGRQGDALDLRIGRFVMRMGSNRFVARHVFRNTLGGFSGINGIWSRPSGPRLQAFVTRPVRRLPFDRQSLESNDVQWDEDAATLFWGTHLDRIKLGEVDASAYVFGIDDSDTARRPSLNRNYVTSGFRLRQDGERWTWEFETALQFGSVRESILPSDRTNLDQRAWFMHAGLGRRFGGAWNPYVELRYDYASGDDNPADGSNERFDTLFGPQRFDYGPTGIYNAVRRVNSSSPGIYVNVQPGSDISWMTGYRASWLASERDLFVGGLLRDPSGASGTFIGHQVETRLRWEMLPGNLRFEVGGAVMVKGEFLENAPSAPDTSDTVYLYSTVLVVF